MGQDLRIAQSALTKLWVVSLDFRWGYSAAELFHYLGKGYSRAFEDRLPRADLGPGFNQIRSHSILAQRHMGAMNDLGQVKGQRNIAKANHLATDPSPSSNLSLLALQGTVEIAPVLRLQNDPSLFQGPLELEIHYFPEGQPMAHPSIRIGRQAQHPRKFLPDQVRLLGRDRGGDTGVEG